MQVILASESPRRKYLLSSIGFSYESYTPNVDESILEGETPTAICSRLSILKAKSASEQFPEALIIAADTLVIVDDKIFGKPCDADEAKLMLSTLSGREHMVITGVTIIYNGVTLTESESTVVHFRKLSECDIEAYISTGEFSGKAGAYAIQGYGSLIIECIEGDYFNVVGLPLQMLSKMLEKIGIDFEEQLNMGVK